MPVRICRISELVQDEKTSSYAIVRSMKNKSKWIEQLSALSPSKDLFFKYRNLANNGLWNKTSFNDIYVPQFITEMHSPEAKASLSDILQRSAKGESIALACFCTDETMCHRSIIAGILQGAGVDVETTSNADYSHFFNIWKNTK